MKLFRLVLPNGNHDEDRRDSLDGFKPSTFEMDKINSMKHLGSSRSILTNESFLWTKPTLGPVKRVTRRLLCLICLVILLGSFTLSLVDGKSKVYDRNQAPAEFYSEFVKNHILKAESYVNALALTPCMKDYMKERSNLKYKSHLENYILGLVEQNEFYLHHIRVINSTGLELIRVDIEHDNSARIAQENQLYNRNHKEYHEDFLFGRSVNKAYTGRWKTHGPTRDGEWYEFEGKDLDGDHQPEHKEFRPLPSLVIVQRSVLVAWDSNITTVEGYVAFNVRMTVLMNDLEHFSGYLRIIVVRENGDFVFNNQDRSTEFESDLGMSQSLSSNVFKYLFNDNKKQFRVGLTDYACEDITIGINVYKLCILSSVFTRMELSPTFQILGFCSIFGFLSCFFCTLCIRKTRKQSKKYKKFINSIYFPEVSRLILSGQRVVTRYQPDLIIIFGDIVGFCRFNQSFGNDPHTLVLVLGNMIEVMDDFAEVYKIYKIKTIGDCYFCVSGLEFGRNKSNSSGKSKKGKKRIKKLRVRIRNAMLFCFVVLHYFEKRYIQLRTGSFPIPDWRFGAHFGGAVSGIMNKRRPYFDMWGQNINISARMESYGVPKRLHISDRMYDVAKMCSSFKNIRCCARRTEMKGFGVQITYICDYGNEKVLDKELKKNRKIVKRYSRIFVEMEPEELNHALEGDNSTIENEEMIDDEYINKTMEKRKEEEELRSLSFENDEEEEEKDSGDDDEEEEEIEIISMTSPRSIDYEAGSFQSCPNFRTRFANYLEGNKSY